MGDKAELKASFKDPEVSDDDIENIIVIGSIDKD